MHTNVFGTIDWSRSVMPVLHARLLGELELRDNTGGEIKLATRKARALLAFMIAEGDKWHSRERLAGLLWSDRQPAQARRSLTQALSSVRKLGSNLRTNLIETDGDRIRLASNDAVSADLLFLREHADDAPDGHMTAMSTTHHWHCADLRFIGAPNATRAPAEHQVGFEHEPTFFCDWQSH